MRDPPPPNICLLCILSSGYIHTRLNSLHLSPYSIRSLEFWFNHLYNHEGNAQNPALSCKLNRGQTSEDQKREAQLSFQMLEVGRRTTQAFILKAWASTQVLSQPLLVLEPWSQRDTQAIWESGWQEPLFSELTAAT